MSVKIFVLNLTLWLTPLFKSSDVNLWILGSWKWDQIFDINASYIVCHILLQIITQMLMFANWKCVPIKKCNLFQFKIKKFHNWNSKSVSTAIWKRVWITVNILISGGGTPHLCSPADSLIQTFFLLYRFYRVDKLCASMLMIFSPL